MTIDIPVSEQQVSDADVLAVVSGLESVRSDLFSLSRPAVSAIQGKAINLIERLCDELLRLRTAQPKEPSIGLLMSMALRLDHGLGCPGYYDQFGQNHARRLEVALNDMRKVYEEISGQGFYKPEREAEYAAMASGASAQPKGDARLLTDEQIAEIEEHYADDLVTIARCPEYVEDKYDGDSWKSVAHIGALLRHIHALQSAPSAQPKGESGVTGEQLDTLEAYVLDHEDANDEYTRNAVSAVRAAIGALRSPAACAASQETARCYSQVFGLPCEKPAGHEGSHSVNVAATLRSLAKRLGEK